ncbi:MAG TPA: hypothetical protein VEC18_00025, partial [Myxococcota bacterium]|nr:hypothetical protein [Myxococcota bacterium]
DVRRAAAIRDASIEDVTPTLLARLGVPLSRRLPGKALAGIFEEPLASSWVDDYADVRVAPPAGRIDASEDDDAERLRAIGYID